MEINSIPSPDDFFTMVDNVVVRQSAVKIADGLVIVVREETYNRLMNNTELNEDFILVTKRQNRWYWMVEFKERNKPCFN